MLGRSVAFGVKSAEKHLIMQNFFELTTPIVHPSPELSRASSKCSSPKMYLSSPPPAPPTRNAKINHNKVLMQTQTKTLQTQPLIFVKVMLLQRNFKDLDIKELGTCNVPKCLLESAGSHPESPTSNFLYLQISIHCLQIAEISSHSQQRCFAVCVVAQKQCEQILPTIRRELYAPPHHSTNPMTKPLRGQ